MNNCALTDNNWSTYLYSLAADAEAEFLVGEGLAMQTSISSSVSSKMTPVSLATSSSGRGLAEPRLKGSLLRLAVRGPAELALYILARYSSV